MFGNLLRECKVLERLSKTAQNELANLVTILLGLTIGSTMLAANFLRWDTLFIPEPRPARLCVDTAGGVLFAKFFKPLPQKQAQPDDRRGGYLRLPDVGARDSEMAKEEDPYNFVLMQATSANVSGQLGSIVAGGLVITLVGLLIGW